MTGFLIFILALLPIATVFLLLVVLAAMTVMSARYITMTEWGAAFIERYNGHPSQPADAPIGSIYHHFSGGKRDIAEAALRQSGAAYGELVGMLLAPYDDIAAGIEAAFGSAAAATSFFAAAISAFCSAALAATSRPPSSLPNGHHQWLEPTCSASAFCSVACLATVCPSSLPNGHHEWLEACSAGALAGCEEASWVWK